jgi:ribosome-associated protein
MTTPEKNAFGQPPTIHLPDSEIHFSFMRSPGPGGQNVNKLETGVILRFDVLNSPSLPEPLRNRLLTLAKNKINKKGELIIKSTTHRTQERNKQYAFERLEELLVRAAYVPKPRKKTRPTKASKERRLSSKKLRGKTKALRRSDLPKE